MVVSFQDASASIFVRVGTDSKIAAPTVISCGSTRT